MPLYCPPLHQTKVVTVLDESIIFANKLVISVTADQTQTKSTFHLNSHYRYLPISRIITLALCQVASLPTSFIGTASAQSLLLHQRALNCEDESKAHTKPDPDPIVVEHPSLSDDNDSPGVG